MTDSSRAGLAPGAAGSCPRPSRLSPARCWEWPWSGGCLCPGWAPDRFVAQEGLPTVPSYGCPQFLTPKPTSRGRRSSRVWEWDSGHPWALGTWGCPRQGTPGRAATDQVLLSGT